MVVKKTTVVSMIIIAKDLALANLYRFASCAEYIDAHFVVILANGNKFKSCMYIYIYRYIIFKYGIWRFPEIEVPTNHPKSKLDKFI